MQDASGFHARPFAVCCDNAAVVGHGATEAAALADLQTKLDLWKADLRTATIRTLRW